MLLFNVKTKHRSAYEVAADIFNYSAGEEIISLGGDGEAVDAYGRVLPAYLPIFISRELTPQEVGFFLDVVELLIVEEELKKTGELLEQVRQEFGNF